MFMRHNNKSVLGGWDTFGTLRRFAIESLLGRLALCEPLFGTNWWWPYLSHFILCSVCIGCFQLGLKTWHANWRAPFALPFLEHFCMGSRES